MSLEGVRVAVVLLVVVGETSLEHKVRVGLKGVAVTLLRLLLRQGL